LGIDANSSGNILVSTSSAEVYEIANNKPIILVLGHYFGGEVWGAATAPNSLEFVTSGGDKTIRKWNIETRRMIAATDPLENDIRSIDWSPNGKFIVIGDYKGFIITFNAKTLKQIDKKGSIFTTMP